MSIQELPSHRFRLQIRRRSLRVDETFDTEAAARLAQLRYLGGDASGRRRKTQNPTLNEAWDLYADSRVFSDKKENTRRTEKSHIRLVLAQLGTQSIKSITADDVDAFIVAQAKDKKAPDTTRNAVAALSSVLSFCHKRGLLPANVTIGVKRPHAPYQARRMPSAEEGALIKALANSKYRYRAAARLALLVRETGARPGEWASVLWEDINFDKNTVVFQNTKYKSMPRTVPLTMAAIGLLAAQGEDSTITMHDKFVASNWLFPAVTRSHSLAPMRYSGTIRDMKRDGIIPKDLRVHNGRHEFISSLVENTDLDDSRIMALVGHHSPASMQIYTHARNVQFRGELEGLEKLRRKDRAKALAGAVALPEAVVNSYLENERRKERDDGLEDEGYEALYSDKAVQILEEVATRLGSTLSERMKKIRAMGKTIQDSKRVNKPSEDNH